MMQVKMEPLGKVGTHDRPSKIRDQRYVKDVNTRHGAPSSPYQPETEGSHIGWKEALRFPKARHSCLPALQQAGPLANHHVSYLVTVSSCDSCPALLSSPSKLQALEPEGPFPSFKPDLALLIARSLVPLEMTSEP